VVLQQHVIDHATPFSKYRDLLEQFNKLQQEYLKIKSTVDTALSLAKKGKRRQDPVGDTPRRRVLKDEVQVGVREVVKGSGLLIDVLYESTPYWPWAAKVTGELVWELQQTSFVAYHMRANWRMVNRSE
jgi:hypothetical protein